MVREDEAINLVADSHQRFRTLVRRWANDPEISNEEFGRLVSQLDWDLAMQRLEFVQSKAQNAGVDTSQPGDVE